MTLRIFTLVHGEPYITWMKNGLVKSLTWPTNHAAIRNAEWHIYTTDEDRERVIEIARAVDIPLKVNIIAAEWAGALLANTVRHCLMDAAVCSDSILICPPDTIFGDQSIETLVALAREPHLVISAAPVRVNQEFMEEFSGQRMPNQELVSMAWKYLHQTWRDANIQLAHTNSFAGGVSWKKIGHGLYAVTHLLPTPFHITPMPSDAEWFRLYGSPGAIDHIWPSKLVDEGRQRFIASSDAAFMVEITMKDKNIPPLYPTDPHNPTNYIGQGKHNHVNRNTVCIFRAA